MIRVNTQTLVAIREGIKPSLRGLDVETLRNLQTRLNPVPADFLNIEYWPENDIKPVIDESIEKYGEEILTANPVNKLVDVSRKVLPLTVQEIADRQAAIDAEMNVDINRELAELDLQSIRHVREWVASQPTAPQVLKDMEALIATKRAAKA